MRQTEGRQAKEEDDETDQRQAGPDEQALVLAMVLAIQGPADGGAGAECRNRLRGAICTPWM